MTNSGFSTHSGGVGKDGCHRSTFDLKYPEARRDASVVEEVSGHKVPDPYRWLEDPDSEETNAFVDAQNKVTSSFMGEGGLQKMLEEKLKDAFNYAKYSCPSRHGQYYYYHYNPGLKNQAVYYRHPVERFEPQKEGEDSSPESEGALAFLDPNGFAEDGTTSIGDIAFSKDDSIIAFTTSDKGSDWETVRFKHTQGAVVVHDSLTDVCFSCLDWRLDNDGVFYNRYDTTTTKADGTETTTKNFQKLYYHKLGTPQSDDVLCLEFPTEPEWMVGVKTTDDGAYALAFISWGCDPEVQVWVADLRELHGDMVRLKDSWVKLADTFDAAYEFVTNDGDWAVFQTNLDAPRYRLVSVNLKEAMRSGKPRWNTLVPECDDVLESAVAVAGELLVLHYLKDVKSQLKLNSLRSGEAVGTVAVPIGAVEGMWSRRNRRELLFKFSSFVDPGSVCRIRFGKAGDPDLLDLKSGVVGNIPENAKGVVEPEVIRRICVKGFVLDKYETQQVVYSSKDGTKVPMFIVGKKDRPSRPAPCLLYGYGGFNISITPFFGVSALLWIEVFNATFAVANIRGGAEYGDKWHEAGKREKKQNVFDDFQAAAEYLTRQEVTTRDMLTIEGASNGGLLVAACANQRPELYGAVVANVGVMDMFRFHKFTIGSQWISEYGDPDNPKDFEFLSAYSPLHNIPTPEKAPRYPAILVTTADHDDRVSPLHSLKFIAELQYSRKGATQDGPLLTRIDTKAGHGSGKPTLKRIEDLAVKYTFMARVLGLQALKMSQA